VRWAQAATERIPVAQHAAAFLGENPCHRTFRWLNSPITSHPNPRRGPSGNRRFMDEDYQSIVHHELPLGMDGISLRGAAQAAIETFPRGKTASRARSRRCSRTTAAVSSRGNSWWY
jgi:hypothetical protein